VVILYQKKKQPRKGIKMATGVVTAPLTPAQQQQRAKALDQQATNAIIASALFRQQLAGSGTVFPASNPQLIIQPINVGLVLRYMIIVTGTISNTGSTTITATDTGLANLFGPNGIVYTDLNNYQRVNTSGLHLSLVANAKRKRPLGGNGQFNTFNGANASQMLNTPPATWGVFQYPQTIASGSSAPFRAVFELPLAYSNTDLRGAVWANVLNAVQQITLTFNTAIVTAGTADSTYAIYSGAAGSAGSITSATYTIYQQYYDQLPKAIGQGGAVSTVVPNLSLSTIYELKQLRNTAIPQNQEFYYAYSNQRAYLSTYAIWNNSGLAAGRTFGSDVNYWALVASNSSYIWKLDPLTVAQQSRDHLGEDLPAGCYYFPTREHNISTQQYGNIQLTLNAATASANDYMDVMLEDFALLSTLQSGPSMSQS
jgi:P3 major capsid protein